MPRSHLRSTIALRPLTTILFATFAACAAPGCGSDGGEDVSGITDSGDETAIDTGATETGSPDTGTPDTIVEETAADAGDDTDMTDSGSDTVTDDTGADTATDDTGADTATDDTGTDTATDDTGTDTATDDTGVIVADSGSDTEPDTTVADTGVDSEPADTGAPDTGIDTGPVVPTVASLGLGYQHSCAAMSSGDLYCWGGNLKGQLGNGTVNATSAIPSTPALTNVKEVGAGDDVTCALLNDGSVKCAGWYFYGSLGDGRIATTGTAAEMTFVNVAGLSGASKLYVGHLHSCVLMPDGSAKCWGYNDSGQLGTQSNGTTKVPGISDVKNLAGTGPMTGIVGLSLGRNHTCALLNDKGVLCWGANTYGQVGNGVIGTSTTPVLVPASPIGVSDVKQIEAGIYHTCAVHTDGTVSCWGSNYYGSIGDGSAMGTTEKRPTPVKVAGLSNVEQLALGENYSCARLTSGGVSCWGWGNEGQLGIEPTGHASTTYSRNVPVAVTGITNAVDLVAGYDHVCAKLADGTRKCWGSDANGQLGLGTVFDYNTPTRNPGLSSVAQIDMSGVFSSGGHGCAVMSDKTLKCWGRGREGQIGTATFTDSFVPATIAGMTAVEHVALGEKHSCALLTGGSVSCWGDGYYGALGGGGSAPTAITPTATPVAVSGVTSAKQLVAGARFNCVLLTDGTVSCWGKNDQGQLADGGTTHSASPKPIASLVDIKAIAAGGEHACAISNLDGSVSCWGENDSYQAGNSASTTDVKTPLKLGLPTGTTATALALGQDHTCILLSDKTVACFGANTYGQTGNGVASSTDVKVPTVVAGLTDVTKIWAGDNYTCALRDTGVVRCWGFNGNGQIADGSFDDRSTPGPALVGLPSWSDLGLGRGSACAVLTDGTGRCWGGIYWGALGDGNSEYRWTPVQLPL